VAFDKKDVAISGGVEPEFAADRFFGVRSGAAIVFRQLFYRLAGYTQVFREGPASYAARRSSR